MADYVSNIDCLEKILTEISDGGLLAIFKERAEINDYEERIYPMSEFNSLNEGKTPLEVVECIDKNFDVYDEFFYIDNCGDFCSTSDIITAVNYFVNLDEVGEFVADYWSHVLKVLGYEDIDLLKDRAEEYFTEYIQEKTDLPLDWLMLNIDPETCIIMDWDDYIEELKEEYENEMSDEE